ncbi:hypothetical protein LJC19_08170 [Oxalobacter sp. OttesenSCG-928-P03]|nr:hypothetical protein [Oxalobacter sp. OttesenSCG-928-P03]
MPVFGMNVPCTITKLEGSDVYGKAKFGKEIKTKCSVASLMVANKDTTVRADSSGTRGHAEEVVSDAKLLFHKNTDISLGDKLTLPHIKLSVVAILPRYNVWSVLDHLEVLGVIE